MCGGGSVAWHTTPSDSHGGKMIPCGRTLKADFGLLVPLVYEIKGHRVGAAPIGRTPQGWFRHTVAPLVTRRRHFIRSVYETQNQTLANGIFDGATTLRCAPLTFGTFSDSLRPMEDHFAMSRKVTQWKFPLLPYVSMRHLHYICYYPRSA